MRCIVEVFSRHEWKVSLLNRLLLPHSEKIGFCSVVDVVVLDEIQSNDDHGLGSRSLYED